MHANDCQSSPDSSSQSSNASDKLNSTEALNNVKSDASNQVSVSNDAGYTTPLKIRIPKSVFENLAIINDSEKKRQAIEMENRMDSIPKLSFDKNGNERRPQRKLFEPIVVTKKRRNRRNKENKRDPDYRMHDKIQ